MGKRRLCGLVVGVVVATTGCIEVVATRGPQSGRPAQAAAGASVQGGAYVAGGAQPSTPGASRQPAGPPPAADVPAGYEQSAPPPGQLPSARAGAGKRVAVGEAHVCAIEGGGVRCWGTNLKGTLGVGSTVSPTSGVVRGIGDDSVAVVDIAAGNFHTCAVKATGDLWCWGSNHTAQLGQGKATDRPINTPQRVDLRNVEAVYAGAKTTCAVQTGGKLWCWGRNVRGAIPGGSKHVTRPTRVDALRAAAELAIGGYSICALGVDGRVWCTGALSRHDRQVAEQPPATSLTAGWNHACAVAGGKVHCWGSNFVGAAGLGDPCGDQVGKAAISSCRSAHGDVSRGPAVVPNIDGAVVQVDKVCALYEAGGVTCWSGSQARQFATRRKVANYDTAHRLELLGGVDELFVGSTFVCFARQGELRCGGMPWSGKDWAAEVSARIGPPRD